MRLFIFVVSFLRNACWALSNFLRGHPSPRKEQVAPSVPCFSSLLDVDDLEVQTDALWGLVYASYIDVQGFIVEAPDVLNKIMVFLKNANQQLVVPSLKILIAVAAKRRDKALEPAFLNVIITMCGDTRRNVALEASKMIINLAKGTIAEVNLLLPAFPTLCSLMGNRKGAAERSTSAWGVVKIISSLDDDVESLKMLMEKHDAVKVLEEVLANSEIYLIYYCCLYCLKVFAKHKLCNGDFEERMKGTSSNSLDSNNSTMDSATDQTEQTPSSSFVAPPKITRQPIEIGIPKPDERLSREEILELIAWKPGLKDVFSKEEVLCFLLFAQPNNSNYDMVKFVFDMGWPVTSLSVTHLAQKAKRLSSENIESGLHVDISKHTHVTKLEYASCATLVAIYAFKGKKLFETVEPQVLEKMKIFVNRWGIGKKRKKVRRDLILLFFSFFWFSRTSFFRVSYEFCF